MLFVIDPALVRFQWDEYVCEAGLQIVEPVGCVDVGEQSVWAQGYLVDLHLYAMTGFWLTSWYIILICEGYEEDGGVGCFVPVATIARHFVVYLLLVHAGIVIGLDNNRLDIFVVKFALQQKTM